MDRTQEIKKDLLLIRLVCNCGDTAVEDTIYGDLKIKSPSGRKEIYVKNLFVSRADSPKMFSAKFPMVNRDDPNTEYRHANSRDVFVDRTKVLALRGQGPQGGSDNVIFNFELEIKNVEQVVELRQLNLKIQYLYHVPFFSMNHDLFYVCMILCSPIGKIVTRHEK